LGHVKAFDGLRGVLAIWVLLGHWGTTIAWPVQGVPADLWNPKAVHLFIILSGFAMATLIDRQRESYRIFILRRFLRIFPIYWLYLFLSVATIGMAYSLWSQPGPGAMQQTRAALAQSAVTYFWPHILAHIPAAQALIPNWLLPYSSFTFLGQAWSISLEWQFYLVVPLAIAAFMAGLRNWKVAAALVLCLLALGDLSNFLPMGFIGGYLTLFALGIGTYYFLDVRSRGVAWASRLPILPVAVIAIGFVLLTATSQSFAIAVWLALAAGIAIGDDERSPLRPVISLLNLRFVQVIGGMSYSVYLSHMLVLTPVLYLLIRLGVAGSWTGASLLLVLTLAGTLALSAASYLLIEQPFQELGRRISAQAASTDSSEPVTTVARDGATYRRPLDRHHKA